MELMPGYKLTEVGVIPEDWDSAVIGEVTDIRVGRDLHEDGFSTVGDSTYRFPVYSNTVANDGLYGFYSVPEYEGDSVTVVGRGVGLGTAFARKGAYGAIGRLLVLLPGHRADARFLATYINQRVKIFVETGGIPQLTGIQFSKYKVALPPLPEQRAIATVLSDVDVLLGTLERLIAKKRDLKQAAMQQLLTGQTRLPGFQGEWEVRTLENLATFHKGKGLPKSALNPFGSVPCIHYGELFTQYTETIEETLSRTDESPNHFRSVANDVLMPTSDVTPRGLAKASCVTVDNVVLGGDILVIRADPELICGSFLSYVIRREDEQVLRLVTGTTVFHLYGSDMKKFTFSMPPVEEQRAIVAVLSDMDAELSALEQRRDKTRALKQAMMQELLTGKTRLVPVGGAHA